MLARCFLAFSFFGWPPLDVVGIASIIWAHRECCSSLAGVERFPCAVVSVLPSSRVPKTLGQISPYVCIYYDCWI